MVLRIQTVLCGAFGLILSVLGAVGAHLLDNISMAALKPVWDSALLFGFVHVIAAMRASSAPSKNRVRAWSSWAFLIGVVLFSLNILLATAIEASTGSDHLNALGALAPIGGVAYMIGWILLGVAAFRTTDVT